MQEVSSSPRQVQWKRADTYAGSATGWRVLQYKCAGTSTCSMYASLCWCSSGSHSMSGSKVTKEAVRKLSMYAARAWPASASPSSARPSDEVTRSENNSAWQ